MQLLQNLIVALLVAGCAVYAAWALMPAAARRGIAGSLLKLPLPAAFERKMRKAATVSSGCGCDGCDHAPAKTARAKSQVVTFHHRPTRR
ncbi:MAG TPA: hypothetical protein VNU48_11760 [Burkholderiaceae bacterium]|nr:hypothetical protein [Burkholderiaceae bacterium]